MTERPIAWNPTPQSLDTQLPNGRGGWSGLPHVEVDEIFGLDAAFKRDPRPEVREKGMELGSGKMNLSIGVFVDDLGKLYTFQAVTHARGHRFQSGGMESPYLNQIGYQPFVDGVNRLIYGENSTVVSDGRAATIQTVGGGNALFMGAFLYGKSMGGATPQLLLSENTWPNHPKIFSQLGYEQTAYSDYDKKTHAFQGDGLLEAIEELSGPTLLLLQPSCSNPTGNRASSDWWETLRGVIEQKAEAGVQVTVFFDAAYQGLGESIESDVAPVRLFAASDIPMMTAWSGSKNFGLYGSRVGALSVRTGSTGENALVLANLRELVRSVQSNCPREGAELVGDVLSDRLLIGSWEQDLARMRSILKMRRGLLADAIEREMPGYDTGFIRNGQGFFSHFGLSDGENRSLKESGIYLPMKGRVTFPLLRHGNVEYFARALKRAIEDGPGAVN